MTIRLLFRPPSPSTRRTAQGRSLGSAVFCLSTLALSLTGCSGDDNSASSGSPASSATAPATSLVATPNILPPDAGVTTTAISQPQVSAAVIETPPEILTTNPRPALLNDYVAAPEGTSTVLEVLTPEVTVYETATGFDVKTVLSNPLPSGAPLTFLVDGQTSTRYKVLLPIRPNGSTGWIGADALKKYVHDYRIVVELSAFRLTVYKGKDIALTEKIGIGTDELPTPNGRYYLKELLKSPNPGGIYGPYAYGLSGFSQQLTKWNGGDGVIGIHGTNQPELIGRNISHGCIRMTNSAITKLASFLPLGTPVIIQP